MRTYFKISGIAGPWGDYGSVLRHGLARRECDRLILQRTGPFVPHVSCPYSELIVDNVARASIDSSGASGFKFQPVELEKVVNIPWETWLGEPEPRVYPDGGEPGSYFLDAPHDTKIAEKIPTLFAIDMPRVLDVQGRKPTILIDEKVPDADIFGANAIWVSDIVADAIRPHIDEYVQLEPVEME